MLGTDKELFVVGDKIYGLFYCYNLPENLLPIRGEIIRVEQNKFSPLYYVKVLDVIENDIYCIRSLLKGGYVKQKFGTGSKTIQIEELIPLYDFTDIHTFNEYIKENEIKLTLNSMLSYRKKEEMISDLCLIQDFIIEKTYTNLYFLQSRIIYKNGNHYISNKKEWIDNLEKNLFTKEERTVESVNNKKEKLKWLLTDLNKDRKYKKSKKQ